ncbi:MAG TPA: Rne/Rng family ribonuclease, partial [Sulfurimonas sp.]|nr:Rne/Rng family ribonuclease [Sulfurimonas sp.]
KVVRVLPGMAAAFIDVGLERSGFLYVKDACLDSDMHRLQSDRNRNTGTLDLQPTNAEVRDGTQDESSHPLIGDILTAGQHIIVQVQKDPLGTKGARLTRHVALPGRYVVLAPFSGQVGVSQRIQDQDERERLRAIIGDLAVETGYGLIARTAGEGIEAEVIAQEAHALTRLWESIESESQDTTKPKGLFVDVDLSLRVMRDLMTSDVESIAIDSFTHGMQLQNALKGFATRDDVHVEIYDSAQPIFTHFGVETAIERALQKKVWLKSGGYIVIEETEALAVIDVNTGRYVGSKSLEDTITEINMEASVEIAYQLRLRNLGGIIIIDFIDMHDANNRQRLLDIFEQELAKDRTQSRVTLMSELGLVEMTRKRVRESLGEQITQDCPY